MIASAVAFNMLQNYNSRKDKFLDAEVTGGQPALHACNMILVNVRFTSTPVLRLLFNPIQAKIIKECAAYFHLVTTFENVKDRVDFVWKLDFSKQMPEILGSAKTEKLGLLEFSCDTVQKDVTNMVNLLTELIVGR